VKTPSFIAIETERLILRQFRNSDLASFMAYRNDPEVARYQSWESITRRNAEKFHRGAEPASARYRGQVVSVRRGNQARWNTGGRLRFAGPQIGTANRRDRLYVRARISGQRARDLRPRAQWWITDSTR